MRDDTIPTLYGYLPINRLMGPTRALLTCGHAPQVSFPSLSLSLIALLRVMRCTDAARLLHRLQHVAS